tara:strand:- start:1041 stop:1439 length:399 start_codon:yes stop_codon:yes gene_type:complete
MGKLGTYSCDEALNIEHTGGDHVAIKNDGDGQMFSRDVTNYKKIRIKFGNSIPGLLTGGLQYYGLTFTRNAAETFTLPNSSSLHFELNKALIEIDIPTSVNGVEVNKSNGDTIYMNFRSSTHGGVYYAIELI